MFVSVSVNEWFLVDLFKLIVEWIIQWLTLDASHLFCFQITQMFVIASMKDYFFVSLTKTQCNLQKELIKNPHIELKTR